MFSLFRSILVVVASLILGAAATAGPVSDFEKAMRGAYADYRTALFLTNSGNRDEVCKGG